MKFSTIVANVVLGGVIVTALPTAGGPHAPRDVETTEGRGGYNGRDVETTEGRGGYNRREAESTGLHLFCREAQGGQYHIIFYFNY